MNIPRQLIQNDRLRVTLDDALSLERTLGPAHASTLRAKQDLARTLRSHGECDEAVLLCRAILSDAELTFGRDHEAWFAAMHDLACGLAEQRKWGEAEAMEREVLDRGMMMGGGCLGEWHPVVIQAMMGLANVLREEEGEDRLGEAEEVMRRALEKCEVVFGGDDGVTITAMDRLARILCQEGKFEEAELMLEEALEASERVFGREHGETNWRRGELARVLVWQGHLEKAAGLVWGAIERYGELLGKEHPDTIWAEGFFAVILRHQGASLGDSEKRMNLAVKKSERLLRDDEADTTTEVDITVASMVEMLTEHGFLDEAGRLALEMLERSIRMHGTDHPETIGKRQKLAQLQYAQGNLEVARQHLETAFTLCGRVFGRAHTNTTEAVDMLAIVLRDCGEYAEADVLCRDHLAGCRRRNPMSNEPPPPSPFVLGLMETHAMVLERLQRYDGAVKTMKKVVHHRRRLNGSEHSSTAFARAWLARLLLEQGKTEDAGTVTEEVKEKGRDAVVMEELTHDGENPELAENEENIELTEEIQKLHIHLSLSDSTTLWREESR